MGFCFEKSGEVIGLCGLIIVGRMDVFILMMFEFGIKVLIGKGKRNEVVKEVIKKYGSIYFVIFGGAVVLI